MVDNIDGYAKILRRIRTDQHYRLSIKYIV
jgi:hypothetical protein